MKHDDGLYPKAVEVEFDVVLVTVSYLAFKTLELNLHGCFFRILPCVVTQLEIYNASLERPNLGFIGAVRAMA